MKNLFTKFTGDESGAVTVDWVVLTSLVVALGLLVLGIVQAGAEGGSNDIAAQIASVGN